MMQLKLLSNPRLRRFLLLVIFGTLTYNSVFIHCGVLVGMFLFASLLAVSTYFLIRSLLDAVDCIGSKISQCIKQRLRWSIFIIGLFLVCMEFAALYYLSIF